MLISVFIWLLPTLKDKEQSKRPYALIFCFQILNVGWLQKLSCRLLIRSL